MQGAYLGPEFGADEMVRLARRHRRRHKRYRDYDELSNDVAALLAQGQVVGWFQGRMEFGPRALGNRSILGDPRHPEMQKAPQSEDQVPGRLPALRAVGADGGVRQLFRVGHPVALYALGGAGQAEKRHPLPPDYENLEMFDRLYHLRSEVPAITHVDYSARIQTVHQETQ